MVLNRARGILDSIQETLDPRVAGGRTGRSSAHGQSIPSQRLRVMSFNMQAGMAVTRYSHYLTRSWRHVLPSLDSRVVLHHMAQLMRHCDIVALQEVDGGSLRSGFINQLQHLAHEAGFSFCHQQVNRDLGRLGQYTNGLMARFAPFEVEEHQLPGLRGRGAIVARFGSSDAPLLVLNLHLALSVRGRNQQLSYVRQLIGDAKQVVLMGDLNCSHEELLRSPMGDAKWQWTYGDLNTYPSWRPVRRLDHILVSPGIRIHHVSVLDCQLSDHRPVVMDIEL